MPFLKQLQLLIPLILENFFNDAESKEGDARKSVKTTLFGMIVSVVIFASLLGQGLGALVKKNADDEEVVLEKTTEDIKSDTYLEEINYELLVRIVADLIESDEIPNDLSDSDDDNEDDIKREELINRLRRLYELKRNEDESD